MTEAQLTRTFLARWRARYPHASVLKINDRTTSGVPDAAITQGGRTLWIEFKKDNYKPTELQRTTLLRLDRASEGRAFLVVFNTRDKAIRIYDATDDDATACYRTFTAPRAQDDAIDYLVGCAEYGR